MIFCNQNYQFCDFMAIFLIKVAKMVILPLGGPLENRGEKPESEAFCCFLLQNALKTLPNYLSFLAWHFFIYTKNNINAMCVMKDSRTKVRKFQFFTCQLFVYNCVSWTWVSCLWWWHGSRIHCGSIGGS